MERRRYVSATSLASEEEQFAALKADLLARLEEIETNPYCEHGRHMYKHCRFCDQQRQPRGWHGVQRVIDRLKFMINEQEPEGTEKHDT
jgi:hypothetical protein